MQIVRPEAGGAVFINSLGISLNFAVAARIRGSIDLPQMQAGLATLGRRHELLGVRAATREDGTPYFTDENLPPISLRVVDRRGDTDWVDELVADVQKPTAYLVEPMIRFVWVRGDEVSDLVLICDHMVADGKAAIYALRDLLAALGDPSRPIEPIESPPLPSVVPGDIAAQIVEDAVAAGYTRVDEPEPEPEPGAEPPRWREPMPELAPVTIRPFELDAAETAALVARCRAEGVTVQAALCAAFLTPFAERDPERQIRRAEIPVDLRPRLSRPVGDAYGCMIGLTEIDVDCTPGSRLWDTARNAAASLANLNFRELFATPLVVITLAERYPNRPWVIGYDLSISNIGRLDIPEEYGRLRLESIYGPVFPATLPEHLILGVSTFAGRLRCTYSSRNPDADALQARGLELLRSMIR